MRNGLEENLFQVFPKPFNACRSVSNISISATQEKHILKGFAESGH